MKNIIYLLLVILTFSALGCNDYNNRIIRKTILLTNGRSVELYNYSLIGGNSPDYIDFKAKSGDHQHILINYLVCDVNIFVDTLKISTSKKSTTIFLDNNITGLKIEIDSTKYCSHSDITNY